MSTVIKVKASFSLSEPETDVPARIVLNYSISLHNVRERGFSKNQAACRARREQTVRYNVYSYVPTVGVDYYYINLK